MMRAKTIRKARRSVGVDAIVARMMELLGWSMVDDTYLIRLENGPVGQGDQGHSTSEAFVVLK